MVPKRSQTSEKVKARPETVHIAMGVFIITSNLRGLSTRTAGPGAPGAPTSPSLPGEPYKNTQKQTLHHNAPAQTGLEMTQTWLSV